MPELPEVEVLSRHLDIVLRRKTIRGVRIRRSNSIRPTSASQLRQTMIGTTFSAVERRGKYLVLHLRRGRDSGSIRLLGHLGMTGRMYLQPALAPLPKHTVVALDLGRTQFIFEDTRKFGRFTMDLSPLERLGPEPLSRAFSPTYLYGALQRYTQEIKSKLLSQDLVAGLGNIYACEVLFQAGIHPSVPANRLQRSRVEGLHGAIEHVLEEAIQLGDTLELDWKGTSESDGLFYYGQKSGVGGASGAGAVKPLSDEKRERFHVYDRAGEPCLECATEIKRMVQAARSTYFCPKCQKKRR